MDFGIAVMAPIAILCFLAGYGVKVSRIDNKWIPIICGALGGVIGVAGMYAMPDFPASDWINAAAIGVASGLSATGAHQAYKQVKG